MAEQQRYHISKGGVPRVCDAPKGKCPLGGEDIHLEFGSKGEAYDWYLESLEKENPTLPSGLKKETPREAVPRLSVGEVTKLNQVYDTTYLQNEHIQRYLSEKDYPLEDALRESQDPGPGRISWGGAVLNEDNEILKTGEELISLHPGWEDYRAGDNYAFKVRRIGALDRPFSFEDEKNSKSYQGDTTYIYEISQNYEKACEAVAYHEQQMSEWERTGGW